MANHMSLEQAMTRMRSGRRMIIAQPSTMLLLTMPTGSRTPMPEPEPWQGKGKRKKRKQS